MSSFRRLELQSQFASLRQPGNCPEGVYLSPLPDFDEWNGIVFVHKGYYKGSVVRFTIRFPQSFPLRAPIVHFAKGQLIHPLVDPRTDRLALASGFPRWDAKADNVPKILFFIKGIFKNYALDRLNDGLAINAEAWRLYQSNRPLFAKLAAQCASITTAPSTLYAQPTTGTLSTVDADGERAKRDRKEVDISDLAFREIGQEELDLVREAIFGEANSGGDQRR